MKIAGGWTIEVQSSAMWGAAQFNAAHRPGSRIRVPALDALTDPIIIILRATPRRPLRASAGPDDRVIRMKARPL